MTKGKYQRSIAHRADDDAQAQIAALRTEVEHLSCLLRRAGNLDEREAQLERRASQAVMALATAKQFDKASERAAAAEARAKELEVEVDELGERMGKVSEALLRQAPPGVPRWNWVWRQLGYDHIIVDDNSNPRLARRLHKTAQALGLSDEEILRQLGKLV